MAEAWSYTLEFRGESFELEERRMAIGRSRSCDVPVKDPSVSRRHVMLKAIICGPTIEPATAISSAGRSEPKKTGCQP